MTKKPTKNGRKPTDPPPLTDLTKPWGVIHFIHFRDGKEHTFYSAVNDLTKGRMSAFDHDPPDVDAGISYGKSVFRDIRAKATKVLGYKGTKHFL